MASWTRRRVAGRRAESSSAQPPEPRRGHENGEGDRLAGPVGDGRRNCRGPGNPLVLVERDACDARVVHLAEQRGPVEDGAARQAVERLRELGPCLIGGQGGEQGLAVGGAVQRQAIAGATLHAQAARRVRVHDDDDLDAVEDGELHGLTALDGELSGQAQLPASPTRTNPARARACTIPWTVDRGSRSTWPSSAEVSPSGAPATLQRTSAARSTTWMRSLREPLNDDRSRVTSGARRGGGAPGRARTPGGDGRMPVGVRPGAHGVCRRAEGLE